MKDAEPRAQEASTLEQEDATLVRPPTPVPPGAVPQPDLLADAVTRVRGPYALLHSLSRGPGPLPSGTAPVARGLTLADRYTVLDSLGRGGMGEVLSAYDARLDRRVALKRLHRDALHPQSQEDLETRLVREAQAMARLSHPNVVAIYDVGTLEDGTIFIAMEMVEGRTLRRWCEERPRSWREVLAVFLEAGRGLAAAHEAGLVHRDFKPENVLVGNDGRVRVTDFGLARAGPGAPPAEGPGTPPPSPTLPPGALDSPLTLQGTLLGTPRFMAPELLRAGPADARSDLFAFCVALHEALYGQHPFSGATQAESLQAQLAGRVKPPPEGAGVPAWVERTLLSGLRAAPSERPASMRALVAALEKDPEVRRRTRRRAAGMTLLGAVLMAAVLGLVRLRQERARDCAHQERRLAGTWDGAVRAQVQRAFLGTGLPYAQDTFTRVSTQLDDYAATWARMRTETCEALRTQEPTAPGPGVLEAWCLERRRGQLKALTELFVRGPSPEHLARAVQAAQMLPPLAECADARALTSTVPLPEDPAVRARVEALQVQVDRLETLKTTGQYKPKEELKSAEALLGEVERVDYGPLRAQTLYQLATLKEAAGDYAGAEALVRSMLPLAARSRDLVLVARAWTLLLRQVVYRQARYPEAPDLMLAMESAVECADDDRARSDALNEQAIALQAMGREEEARVRHERALTLREKTLGPEHLLVANSRNNLGVVLGALGRHEEARSEYERALGVRREVLGPDHPLVAQSYNNLGTALVFMGRYDEARDLYEHALAIRKKTLGLEHPDVALSYNNLGMALENLGRYEEALTLYENALRFREKALGPEHPDTANSLNCVGNALRGLGRLTEARARIEQSLRIREQRFGPEHADVASTLDDLGRVLLAQKHPEEAQARYTRALALQEKALGPEHADVAASLAGLGDVRGALGRPEEARDWYTRALAVREKTLGVLHPLTVETRAKLDQVLARLKRPERTARDVP